MGSPAFILEHGLCSSCLPREDQEWDDRRTDVRASDRRVAWVGGQTRQQTKRWGTPGTPVPANRTCRRVKPAGRPGARPAFHHPRRPWCALFPSWCPKLLRFIRVCHLSTPASLGLALSPFRRPSFFSTFPPSSLTPPHARCTSPTALLRPPRASAERHTTLDLRPASSPPHTQDTTKTPPHSSSLNPHSLTPILALPQSYLGSHWRLTGQLTP